VSWIRALFDASRKEFDKLGRDKQDRVADLARDLARGLDGVPEAEVRRRLAAVEGALRDLAKGRKLYGPVLDDVLTLKYLHQRYTNYLRWLTWRR